MVTRHEFLRGVHKAYRPRSYLEVGIRDGRSLALSRVPSIGIDPEFKITAPLQCDVQLVKATSDDFFAAPDALAHLPHGKVDLAFIDGMHLFEFVLRDFINVERNARWTSVIVCDDMLPRSDYEALREFHRGAWTGDVFKLLPVLRRYRPDLTCIELDTQPTGLLLILGADPGNTTLRDNYEAIISEYLTPDPQSVPAEVLGRTRAVDPNLVLRSRVWQDLRTAILTRRSRERGYPALQAAAQRWDPVPPPTPLVRAVRPVRRRLGRLRRLASR